MTEQDIEKVVRDYITKTVHMSLGTVRGDKPWVCEVHFAYDDGLNLNFVSKTNTRHCQEIADNPYVAGNIVRQHDLTEAPNGIYFEGTADMVEATSENIERYVTALGRDIKQVTEDLRGNRGMYRITVNSWAAFGNFDGNGYAKHELKWRSTQ